MARPYIHPRRPECRPDRVTLEDTLEACYLVAMRCYPDPRQLPAAAATLRPCWCERYPLEPGSECRECGGNTVR